MNQKTTVRVVIHGAELSFRTDDPEYIRELAGFVDEEIGKIISSGKVASPTKAVTLAAFNIADELFRLRKEESEMSKTLSERFDVLLEMTDEAYRSTRHPDTHD